MHCQQEQHHAMAALLHMPQSQGGEGPPEVMNHLKHKNTRNYWPHGSPVGVKKKKIHTHKKKSFEFISMVYYEIFSFKINNTLQLALVHQPCSTHIDDEAGTADVDWSGKNW